jgi:hypothetical protein
VLITGESFQGTSQLQAEDLQFLEMQSPVVLGVFAIAIAGRISKWQSIVVNPSGNGFVYTIGSYLGEASGRL